MRRMTKMRCQHYICEHNQCIVFLVRCMTWCFHYHYVHIRFNGPRVWNAAEASGIGRLRTKVLSVLDFRLEAFLAKDIFMFLGIEEIKQILCRETLCVRSEKILFDGLTEWIRKKVLKDDSKDNFEEKSAFDTAAELLCLVKLDVLPFQYVRNSLSSLRLPITHSSKSCRKCENCFYFFEYSRAEVSWHYTQFDL